MKEKRIENRLSAALSFLFSVALAFGLTQRVAAQTSSNTERFVPALDPEGFITVQGTRTPGSLLWNMGLFLSYSYDSLVVTAPDNASVSVFEHRVTTDISVEAGLGGRFALGFSLPFGFSKRRFVVAISSGRAETYAVGDPTVALRYRFIGDNSDEERDHHDGPGLRYNSVAHCRSE